MQEVKANRNTVAQITDSISQNNGCITTYSTLILIAYGKVYSQDRGPMQINDHH